jgi:hypothetical protein
MRMNVLLLVSLIVMNVEEEDSPSQLTGVPTLINMRRGRMSGCRG